MISTNAFLSYAMNSSMRESLRKPWQSVLNQPEQTDLGAGYGKGYRILGQAGLRGKFRVPEVWRTLLGVKSRKSRKRV